MVSAYPGVALPLGGQRPISLEYQIYLPAIDTIVTGMLWWTLFVVNSPCVHYTRRLDNFVDLVFGRVRVLGCDGNEKSVPT